MSQSEPRLKELLNKLSPADEAEASQLVIDIIVGTAGRVMEAVFAAHRTLPPDEFEAWVSNEVGAYR